MEIRAAEISDIIRKQIEDYDKKVEVSETGTVLTAGDGIARVYGLSGAMAGELLEFRGSGGANRTQNHIQLCRILTYPASALSSGW